MASPSTAVSSSKTAATPSSTSTTSNSLPARPRNNTNGVNGRFKSNDNKPTRSSPAKDVPNADRQAHDRLLFLMANFVGYNATVTVKNGDQFSGIFSAASLDSTANSQYILKMCRKLPTPAPGQTNGTSGDGTELIGYGDDHVMVFELKDVLDLHVNNVVMDATPKATNGTASTFRTDTDISGNLGMRERELKPWEPAADASSSLSLSASGSSTWNQFETNERLYGVKTDYDENIYTTSIDRSHPSYKQRMAAADRLAREIEGSGTNNPHVAEERGLVPTHDDGVDEETRFSGVRREFTPLSASQNPNRYTPPARRAPTGTATVSGAPVDPAIISAQLARPGSAAKSLTPREENKLPAEAQNTKKSVDAATDNNLKPVDHNEAKQPRPVTAPTNDVDNNATLPKSQPVNDQASTTSNAPAPSLNTTGKIETTVHDAFKSFAAQEKMKVQERQRQSARREKESKLADLKKFATNFKLKTAVPEDMLGILAKDKHKQVEIVERSQRQLQEQTTSPQTTPAQSELATPRSTVAARPEHEAASLSFSAQTPRTDRAAHGSQAAASPRPAPGNLGQRLLSQPQYRDKPTPALPSPLPLELQRNQSSTLSVASNDSATRHGSIPTPSSAALRFNAQAMEFKPNPAASTFSPTGSRHGSLASPTSIRAPLPTAPSPGRTSFFTDKKPRPIEQRLSIKSAFNPIKRMEAEVIAEKKTREFAVNGGIPQAYRTPPTWDTPEENRDKTYLDMYEKTPSTISAISSTGGVMPHHYQLPPHLQPGSQVLPSPGSLAATNHLHPQPHFAHNRDQHNDEHRMHASASNSSAFPSPRFQPHMMAYQQPMLSPMQPTFGQPIAQYPMGMPGQPVAQLRGFPGPQQFVSAQNGQMATPMMMNPSSNGTMLGVAMTPQMAMFSPGQNHMFAMHGGMQHTPTGPGGFSSPRHALPMMQQGSQQGHAMSYVHLAQGQNGAMFVPQHAMPMTPMRPGMPMQPQQSFGASPHLGYQFPTAHRGSSFSGNYGAHQPASHNHAAPHIPQATSHAPAPPPPEHEDAK